MSTLFEGLPKMRILPAVAALALIVGPAAAQTPTPNPQTPIQNPALPTPAQPAVPQQPAGGAPGVPLGPTTGTQTPTTASDFINFAMASDLFEIQTSRAAADRAGTDPVRMLAEKLVAAHTLSAQILPFVLERVGMTANTTTSLTSDQEDMVDQLTAAAPESFDRLYLDQQAEAHRQAIAAFTAYAEGGDNDTLRTYAEMMIPALQAHLAMIEAL